MIFFILCCFLFLKATLVIYFCSVLKGLMDSLLFLMTVMDKSSEKYKCMMQIKSDQISFEQQDPSFLYAFFFLACSCFLLL